MKSTFLTNDFSASGSMYAFSPMFTSWSGIPTPGTFDSDMAIWKIATACHCSIYRVTYNFLL